MGTKKTATAPATKSRTPRPSQPGTAKVDAIKVDAAKADAGKSSEGDASQRRDMKLGYLIHDVSRLRRKAFDVVVKPLGVTRAQWWVVAHLSRHDGMFQKQLADLLDVGKASLGALLDRLESTGFVERRPEPNDRRIKRVFLTKNSHQLLEQLRATECEFNARILAGISDKDKRGLISLLTMIRDALLAIDVVAKESVD
jgi:MarR family transcriptional regulator, transcriptional regulator for hemolysin